MAPNTSRHHAGIPERMSSDHAQGLLSALAITANSIRPKQTERRIWRQTHCLAILFNHLFVATGCAELWPTGGLANARPKIPANTQTCRRDFRIKDDKIANDNRQDHQQRCEREGAAQSKSAAPACLDNQKQCDCPRTKQEQR